ncbi:MULTISPECIES: zinc finger domain-containing protein [unclassified Rhodococcus (in: high G+C Gram-positive bacteria)]|uniref:zinc finger domain-containing protein n=1 Tax=unclassified Rhodococcus (in: high G+C Gram-positive bacteria) TaxID=192944 RepID=UPI003F928E60
MTAARRDAEIVPCPTCHASARTPCVWSTGERRRLPCLARMKAAERYDATDRHSDTEMGSFVSDGLTQLDSDVSERDITEPLHPQEGQ